MFMHGGILHIAFNMLFLWIFGNNVEDSMGRGRFVLFYLLAGIAAAYAQALLDTSATVPAIGASGAVAGVLGGYLLLYPHARVLTLVFIIFFVTLIEIPAVVMLGIWFALQFLPAIGQLATPDVSAAGGGVAYFAHIGGFVFGLAAIKLFANRYRAARPRVCVARSLIVALVFCVGFGGMTAAVAADSGFDILTAVSFLIVLMLMLAVFGALRNPPGD